MFTKITLNERILRMCGLIAAIVLCVGAWGLRSIQIISQKYAQHATLDPSLQDVIDSTVKRIYWTNGILTLLAAIGVFAIGYFLSLILTKNLQNILNRLSKVSHEVSSNALEVFDSVESLSAAVVQQSSSLQETASAGTELSSMVKNNSENTEKAKSISEQSHAAAQKGQKAVEDTIQGIQEIHQKNQVISEEIERNNQELSKIVQLIRDIGEKTKVINDIVFQTKLLSFNASVEAARAGEQGKGFAVVAEEVGVLARMSGNAAQEISKMLENSIKRVDDIVNQSRSKIDGLIKTGKEKVDEGIELAKNCGEVLTEVVHNVSLADSTMGDIALATKEQSKGLEEIAKAVGQLEVTNQQNSTTATKVSDTTMALARQADAQRGIIAELLQMLHGTNKMLVELDFDGAAAAHQSWKFRLAKYLEKPDGSLNANMAKQDGSCILGKWLKGHGSQYSGTPAFQALVNSHRRFHEVLGAIITKADAKLLKEAKEMMSYEGEFAVAATSLVDSLKEIEKVAR